MEKYIEKKLCQHLLQRQFSTSRLHQFSIEIASGKYIRCRFEVLCLLGDSRLRFMKKVITDYKTMYYQSVRRKEIVSSLINGTGKNEKLKSQVLIPLLYIQKQHLKIALRESYFKHFKILCTTLVAGGRPSFVIKLNCTVKIFLEIFKTAIYEDICDQCFLRFLFYLILFFLFLSSYNFQFSFQNFFKLVITCLRGKFGINLPSSLF